MERTIGGTRARGPATIVEVEMKPDPRAALLLVTASLAVSGCFGVRRAEPATVSPMSPILLRPVSQELRGKTLSDVVTASSEPMADVPLTSQLVRRVATDVSDAVVSIYTKTEVPYRLRLSGLRFTVPGEALGSAFFIHASGLLITNNHVVENATQITARNQDDEDFELEVVARDPVLDLALLKVVNPDREFPIIPMGRSEDVAVGDWVIAVGNPLGLGHTVTHGIISQTGRNLEENRKDEPGRHIEFLQTDTPINPGSSGGPLITLGGVWIGVNTAGITGAEGLYFSVPSSQTAEFLESVMSGNGIPDTSD